jgi:hypothetical protein
MAANRARRGIDPANVHGWPPTPSEIRHYISPTHCGGTTQEQNKAAVAHLYGVTMTLRYQVPWATFRSLIISGRGAVVPIRYSVIAPTRFDASPGFVGNHGIYVNERRASDGAYLVGDPLADGRRAGIPKGFQWWPGALLQAAAMAYPSTNTGCVHGDFTPVTA